MIWAYVFLIWFVEHGHGIVPGSTILLVLPFSRWIIRTSDSSLGHTIQNMLVGAACGRNPMDVEAHPSSGGGEFSHTCQFARRYQWESPFRLIGFSYGDTARLALLSSTAPSAFSVSR